MQVPTPIHDHYNMTGYAESIDNLSIVGREAQNIAVSIKKAILTRVNDSSLNRDIGKYQLPDIWYEVLKLK